MDNINVTETSTGQDTNATTFMPLNIGQGNNLDNILNSMQSISTTYSTGIPEIDIELSGGLRAGVTVLAAKPGNGKTTLALQMAETISKTGTQVIYFCNDMAIEDVVAKDLSRTSFLLSKENAFTANSALKHAENELKDTNLFENACLTYKNSTLNLRIIDINSSLKFEDICKIIADYVVVEKSQPIIIIDYLQKIIVEGVTTDKEKMDYLIEQLKVFAITFKLPIIILSSINRMSYNKEITMDALKESGGLEFNADLIIGIQHVGIGEANFNIENAKAKKIWDMELVILKQRMGNSDVKIPLKFYPKFNLFPYYSKESTYKIKKTSDNFKL